MANSPGRRILITGASQGLGLAMARELIGRGHQVWNGARNPEHKALDAEGGAGGVVIDLSNPDIVRQGLADLTAQTDGLDVLINNAGIDSRVLGATEDTWGPFDQDVEVMAGVLQVNTLGTIAVTQSALPLLRNGDRPVVISITSRLGSLQNAAAPDTDAAYCTSKGALNMWTIKAAEALRDEGITVVAVHPGRVSTQMGVPGAELTPEDSASSLADLAENLTVADTGRFLRWDGTDHPW